MKRLLISLPVACLLLGCSKTPETAEAPKADPAQSIAAGLKVYTANCAVCHQVDGYGVSNVQPALVDDDIAAGDTNLLITAVLKGPAGVIPADRPRYSNVMPAFKQLTDQQIADVLTYIRHDFNHGASPVDASQVQTVRAQAGL